MPKKKKSEKVILKGKITKELTLEASWKQTDGEVISNVTNDCDAIVHSDMRTAFNKLIPHLCVICDLKESDRIGAKKSLMMIDVENADTEFPDVSVTGFVIGGTGEDEGVTLIGRKKIGNKVLNLVAPFVKFNSEHEEYKYQDELFEAVNGCIAEIELYLDEDKFGQSQAALDFQEEENAEVNVEDSKGKLKRVS